MVVSQRHHRNFEPTQERRAALDWVARQRRLERLLEQVRGDDQSE